MKKALSVVLALLVALSMFSVVAFAEGEATQEPETSKGMVNFIFIVDGEEYHNVTVESGTKDLNSHLKPHPQKEETDTTKYTFDGWVTEGDENHYYNSTIPVPEVKAGETVVIVYTATYAEKDISGNQSFWNFIETLFERLNTLFEYFATIFNF